MKDIIRICLKDIRCWIVFFFLLRLYGISNPPLETSHSWRQSLTCMMTRNISEKERVGEAVSEHLHLNVKPGFKEVLFSKLPIIFYPLVDFSGEKSGIIGSEFPLFNFLFYGSAKIFGFEYWLGRLLNLLVSSIGIWYFFLLVKKITEEKTAFYASLILLVSVWFTFSRKIMPDTFSCALTIAGVYHGISYLSGKKSFHILLFFLFITFGILSKLPALSLLALLLPILVSGKIEFLRKIKLSSVTFISCVLIFGWYFYWVPHLVDTFGTQLYFPRSLAAGFRELIDERFLTFEKFYFSAFHGFVAFLLFIVGLGIAFYQRNKTLFLILLGSSFLFFIFMLKAGLVFSTHSYYIIPFVPVMAIFAGFALSELKYPSVASLLIVAVVIEGVANQQHDFRIKESNKHQLQLEAFCNEFSSRDDLVAVNGGSLNPIMIYFAHRRGWTMENEKINDINNIIDLKSKGCRFVILDKHRLEENLNLDRFEIISESEHFIVYSL